MALQTTSKMASNRTTGANEPHDESSIDAGTISYPQLTDQIAADDLYQALSNSRRRHVIRAVRDGETDIGTLAREIAAVENDVALDRVESQQRKRVYIALYQNHLDKLDAWDIVDYHNVKQAVTAGPAHEIALEAMAAVSEPHDEPDSMLERVANYIRGGA